MSTLRPAASFSKFAPALSLLLLVLAPSFGRAADPASDERRAAGEAGANAFLRTFECSYESRDLATYGGLMTRDFRFHFGDAEGRAAHPDGWGKFDELESTRHLFEGFVNSQGMALPAARAISLNLGPLAYGGDPEHPGQEDRYMLVVAPTVELLFDFGSGGAIAASGRHAFWLVRGDVAAVDPGQPADPGRWYVRRWVEGAAESLLARVTPARGPVVALALGGAARAERVTPNPSRAGEPMTLALDLSQRAVEVDAVLRDVSGRVVRRLKPGRSLTGGRGILWDGRDQAGAMVPSGVYFLRVRAGTMSRDHRVVRIP